LDERICKNALKTVFKMQKDVYIMNIPQRLSICHLGSRGRCGIPFTQCLLAFRYGFADKHEGKIEKSAELF
jgi:hypothetical protein